MRITRESRALAASDHEWPASHDSGSSWAGRVNESYGNLAFRPVRGLGGWWPSEWPPRPAGRVAQTQTSVSLPESRAPLSCAAPRPAWFGLVLLRAATAKLGIVRQGILETRDGRYCMTG